MDLGLTGKVAAITGGSRGIGLATARRLLAEGAKVAICSRDAGRLEEAARALGGEVLAVAADITDPAAREFFARQAEARFGQVDLLVNSAGTHVRASLDDMTEEQLRRQLDDKLFGFLGMMRALLPGMRARNSGAIVNVIGQAARHPHPDRLPSGIANAAVAAMTKAVADAVARDNVRVNSVCPQYIETEIIQRVIQREIDTRGVDRARAAAGFTRANVLGRLGQPEEIADAIVYLLSARANFVTGSSVSVDGGYHRYVFG